LPTLGSPTIPISMGDARYQIKEGLVCKPKALSLYWGWLEDFNSVGAVVIE